MEMLPNICNMCTRDLPDISMPMTLGLWGYISGKCLMPVLYKFYKYSARILPYVYFLLESLNKRCDIS